MTCRQAEYEQSPPSVCSFCQLQRTERVGVAQCRLVGRPVSPKARSCERNVRSKRHLSSPSAKNVIDKVRASERATRRVLGMPARTSSAWIRVPFPGKYVCIREEAVATEAAKCPRQERQTHFLQKNVGCSEKSHTRSAAETHRLGPTLLASPNCSTCQEFFAQLTQSP